MNVTDLKPVPGPAALVTGAARRIGAGIARELHARGLNVIVHCYRSLDAAHRLVAELNGRRPASAGVAQADFNDARAVGRLVETAGEFALQVLVNNASRFYPTPLAQAAQRDWDELFNSNVRAAYFLSCKLAPVLAGGQGSIVNLLDIHVRRPLPGHSLYCMAKGALLTMTRSLALELAPEVRVNAVAPGAILWPESGDSAEREAILGQIPLRRTGESGDIAAAVAWLALDAPYVTGQVLAVDGGRSLVL